MTTIAFGATGREAERRDALVGRLFQSVNGMMDLQTIYLGDRLGLYRALSDGRGLTFDDLAERAGIHPRYAQEWLEQQAVTGILEVEDAEAAPEARRYSLPAGHAEVLLDQDSLSYFGAAGKFAAALGPPLAAIAEAFRTGGGVPWSAFGDDGREGQGEQNRPLFWHVLGREWLPAIPDVHARLQADPPARVADVGCGVGWSSLGIARAYPNARVDGYDLDEPAIEAAARNARELGLADRVTFHARDARAASGRYQLVTAFECIHDMPQPVEVLRTMRELLAEDGAAIVVDERVAERFTAPGDDMERLFYGFSVLCCLPVGMSEQPSAMTGTVMRPATLRRYALEAGFREVEILPVEHDMFRVYRLWR
jgi:2-polyprenyl-3-methyl-5-hydroxy-6-metoxy-1,4-benzoquinol methylase